MLASQFSLSASKSLLRIWLSQDLRRLGGRIGIDAACAGMNNRGLFRVEQYIGFDVDAERVAAGPKRFAGGEGGREKETRGIVCSILDAPTQIDERADVVVCTQTLNINRHFRPNELEPSIAALKSLVRLGGTLVINVGSKGMRILDSERAILESLHGEFSLLKIRRYGFGPKFRKRRSKGGTAAVMLIAHLWARLMLLSPSIRTKFGNEYSIVYVVAKRVKSPEKRGKLLIEQPNVFADSALNAWPGRSGR